LRRRSGPGLPALVAIRPGGSAGRMANRGPDRRRLGQPHPPRH